MATQNKYDRQIRLWGAHGQSAILSSRICLLNASATGTETLKNLVLPGCGHVTIVDGALVGEADLSNNFFVSNEFLGRPRAEVRGRLFLRARARALRCQPLRAARLTPRPAPPPAAGRARAAARAQ